MSDASVSNGSDTSETTDTQDTSDEGWNAPIEIEFTEDDIAECIESIYHTHDEYINNNILHMSSPNFYEDMTNYTTEILFQAFCGAGMLTNDAEGESYDEFKDFVDDVTEVYMEFCETPLRSMKNVDTDVEQKKDTTGLLHIENQLRHLQKINETQPKQKTPEWHAFRDGLLSASTLWKVFSSDAQRNSLIYEKCKGHTQRLFTNTAGAMHWGVKYEPVTILIYEDLYQTKVGEFGCIQHPKFKYIGASPDGINIDKTSPKYGRMLEIKNIVNREITGIPKEEYWIQTQIQMETCDLDECDFAETRFGEYSSEDPFYEDDSREYKGVMLHFISRPQIAVHLNTAIESSNDPVYIYMPLSVSLDKESIATWIEQERVIQRERGLALLNTIYWYLEQFSCVFIPRNRDWFQKAQPRIEELWKIIEKERKEGFEHRAAKKRESKTTVVRLDEPKTTLNAHIQSYIIENLDMTTSVRCVKME